INSEGFFNLILKTWVGRVPLSSKFREDLLNNETIDANLRGQYASTEPSQERRQLVVSWVTPLPAAELEIDVQASEPVLEDIAATETVAEPEATTPATQSTEPQPESEQPVKPKESQVKVASQSKKLAEQARRQQLAQQLAEEEKAAKILLSRQLYQSELLRHTYKNIRYPSRAVERGQEGSIRVEITVTRDGQLAAMQELENSKFSLLNKAAKRSIERSSPYPPVPEDLEGEEFTFTLPIVFRLE
ncbi:MAG: TonB family protein, partial [Pseudomonadota bacterium]|nr:TonB family protein [Pseudomonadota bacterium]